MLQEPTLDAAQAGSNFGLKDEIRAYWGKRSETFDLSYGHKIRSRGEFDAWSRLIARHAAVGPGDRVLELASGTGEVTRVLLGFGCSVDAIDLCEPMIERARAKHRGAPVRFHLGDAENTMMPDDRYDLVICRHLVWTLVDPQAALADWLRVLKPGGAVVVIDGDWVNRSLQARLLQRLSRLIDRLTGVPRLWDEQAHQRIMRGVFFRDGLKAPALQAMLQAVGFADIRTGPLTGIKRRQFASASWSERLRLLAAYDDTFILSARKPLSNTLDAGATP
jgi:ubiquinone/menaquinone biosynthesis C-methylase UbiE